VALPAKGGAVSENANNAGSSTDLPELENPFVGPRSIPTGKPLFGRDREVRDLFRVLVADRIVLLHGPSGCGKSSLVNAGLIPRLAPPRSRRKGYTVWPIIRLNTEPPADREALAIDRYTLSALAMLAAERVKQGAVTPEALHEMSFGTDQEFSASFDHLESTTGFGFFLVSIPKSDSRTSPSSSSSSRTRRESRSASLF
jgi:energy-coupling factor transporter ATP-binding protein EcfA2